MAAITPNSIVRESMGSSTLLICGFTSGSVNDTWTPSEILPVLSYWAQAVGGLGINEPDTNYQANSGVFTFVQGTSYGPFTLFVMAKT